MKDGRPVLSRQEDLTGTLLFDATVRPQPPIDGHDTLPPRINIADLAPMPPLINIDDFEPLLPLDNIDDVELPPPEFGSDDRERSPWAFAEIFDDGVQGQPIRLSRN